MKILWNSVHPELGTGYGSQTALFAPRIRDLGHDVAICAYYGLQPGFGITRWNDMIVYPADHTGLNKFMLREYAEDHAAGGKLSDVQIITLTDPWTWISRTHGGDAAFDDLRIAAWTPIDHMPIPPGLGTALRKYQARPIAMSRFGEEHLALEGFNPLYVPHGIETDVYKPMPEEALELRRKMGISDDAFVIGMVANNQGNDPPRKAFPQVIQAFAAFHQAHPNSYLYLHCDVVGLNGGMDLTQIIELTGVPHDSVVMVDQARYLSGVVSPRSMAVAYSMFDVLANPAYGEGFGIPIIEAQACGTPVIVTDWTAMPELCGAGWRVDGDPWYDPQHGSFFMYAPIGGIYAAFESAYEKKGDQALRARAREFALQYDVDTVTETYWKPVLEALESDASKVKPPDVRLNRDQRRLKAKAA